MRSSACSKSSSFPSQKVKVKIAQHDVLVRSGHGEPATAELAHAAKLSRQPRVAQEFAQGVAGETGDVVAHVVRRRRRGR